MSGKSFAQITNDVSRALEILRAAIPETMHGFGAMAKGALKEGAVSALHKSSPRSPSASLPAATRASAPT